MVDEFRAVTVDVHSTMADVLDVEGPWSTDGKSLFNRIARWESRPDGPGHSVTLNTHGEGKLKTVAY